MYFIQNFLVVQIHFIFIFVQNVSISYFSTISVFHTFTLFYLPVFSHSTSQHISKVFTFFHFFSFFCIFCKISSFQYFLKHRIFLISHFSNFHLKNCSTPLWISLSNLFSRFIFFSYFLSNFIFFSLKVFLNHAVFHSVQTDFFTLNHSRPPKPL